MRPRSLIFRTCAFVASAALVLPSFAAPIKLLGDGIPNLVKKVLDLDPTGEYPFTFPNNPSGLPDDWWQDFTHQYPHGERWINPG